MRIDHVAINCRDFKGMKSFFMKYFGAIPGADHLSKRTGQTNCFLSFTEGGSRLELMTCREDLSGSVEQASQLMAHLSVSVGSIEQVNLLTRRMENDGYKVLSGPRMTGDGYYESCVEALEGIRIEITE